MSEKIKKIICCLTACAVLTFSCVFMPRQRAEAFVLAPVVGTVAGLFALGLLCYGVSTSSDSDFVLDNVDSFSDAVGFLADPFAEVRTTVCASLFLSAVLPFAEKAYSSGACSSVIQGPGILPDYFTPVSDGKSLYFDISNSPSNISYSCDDFYFNLSFRNDNNLSRYLSIFYDGTFIYFISNSGSQVLSNHISISYYRSSSFSARLFNTKTLYHSLYYQSSKGFEYSHPSFTSDLLFGLQSLGYPIYSSSISIEEYIDTYLVNFDGSLTVEDLLCRPVSSGACDVFNSSKSLDSYHVDSPGNDVLDLGNLLDKTGCESIDDVVSKVYTGDLTASDVIGGLDCRPYVDVDVDTGTIAIPGDTTNSRPISLDKDLSIPSDIANTDTYEPLNPPKDDSTTDKPTLPKGAYAFPLADYFPFCLPFDLYRFCILFVATPKTPEITLDFSTFLPFFDKENPEQYVYTFDLHSLDRLAEIIRTLELFGIVLGIGLITRRIIGW